MLLTMQEAHKSECRAFPNEERIDKVEESMENLEKIVRERNAAYFKLEVSEDATAERSMAFRMDQFGRWRWYAYFLNTMFNLPFTTKLRLSFIFFSQATNL